MLRKHGITPSEGAGGSGERGSGIRGAGDSTGTNAGGKGVGNAKEMVETERLKAVMELGRRDSVRRLLKQVKWGNLPGVSA